MDNLHRALAEPGGAHAGCGFDHFGGAVLLGAPMASLMIGALVAHLSSRLLPSLPYTPVLALLGIIVACIAMHMSPCSHMRGSVEKWIEVDGHAMLFIFLPPLLFADTMHMDWNLAKVSIGQCLLLASTGVILGAVLHAFYAMALPYNWDFSLALGFGAVQAATDPVAVVSLLSSLGAPITLTMIISGESLLNDGTAIVVWNVAFYTYLGEGRNAALYSIQLIFGGLAVGLVFWAVILYWMSLLNRKHGHTDTVVQVGLTIFASYTCFYVAEAVCGVSGVLAVVVMGVGLSATFWPMVCSRETMEHVWHIFEWVLNTFLFQLAGLIIGARLVYPMIFGAHAAEAEAGGTHSGGAVGQLTGTDVGLAVATWGVGLVIRAIVLVSHYPALTRLGYGLTKSDAAVCWWGGLHGGVGLALAMSMEHELREAGQPEQGMRVLLHVSVAAMLTLLVNAPTMAPLLKKLGLTSTSPAKQQKYRELRQRVNAFAWSEYNKLLADGKFTPKSERWRGAIPGVISVMKSEGQARGSLMTQVVGTGGGGMELKMNRIEQPEMPSVGGGGADQERLQETRRAFLGLVRNSYTSYLEEGIIPARSSLHVALIASIAYANDHIDEPLCDWSKLAHLALDVPIGTKYIIKALKPLWKVKKLKKWLVQNGPESYAEAVAFALTAFINAHTSAQEEIRWMFGSKSDSLNSEQQTVAAESAQAIYKAKLFLYELHKVVVGEHIEQDDDVIDYVKARQVAGILLFRLAGFIEGLEKHGVLEEWMAERLLHEVEHDEVGLRSHLKKMVAKAGETEDEQLDASLQQVERLRTQYIELMRKEGIDVETKKTLKERLKPDMEKLKQKKYLPGQQNKDAVAMAVSTSSAAMPPPPGAMPPPPPNGGGDLPPGWKMEADPNSGQSYYVNAATGATQWTVPTV